MEHQRHGTEDAAIVLHGRGAGLRVRTAPKCHAEGAFLRVTLLLQPLGRHRPPRSAAKLKHCLEQVLRALLDLHSGGWAHGDVRWPNIVFVSTANCTCDDAAGAAAPVAVAAAAPTAAGLRGH